MPWKSVAGPCLAAPRIALSRITTPRRTEPWKLSPSLALPYPSEPYRAQHCQPCPGSLWGVSLPCLAPPSPAPHYLAREACDCTLALPSLTRPRPASQCRALSWKLGGLTPDKPELASSSQDTPGRTRSCQTKPWKLVVEPLACRAPPHLARPCLASPRRALPWKLVWFLGLPGLVSHCLATPNQTTEACGVALNSPSPAPPCPARPGHGSLWCCCAPAVPCLAVPSSDLPHRALPLKLDGSLPCPS